jgi:hypothetical protein
MSQLGRKRTGEATPMSSPELVEKRRNQVKAFCVKISKVNKDKLVREVFCPSLKKRKARNILSRCLHGNCRKKKFEDWKFRMISIGR